MAIGRQVCQIVSVNCIDKLYGLLAWVKYMGILFWVNYKGQMTIVSHQFHQPITVSISIESMDSRLYLKVLCLWTVVCIYKY